MENTRQEIIDKAKAKRRRKKKVKAKVAAAGDPGIVEQVKDVIVDAAEKVGGLVKSAAVVVKDAVSPRAGAPAAKKKRKMK